MTDNNRIREEQMVEELYAKFLQLSINGIIEKGDEIRYSDTDGNVRISCYCHRIKPKSPLMHIRISNHNPILANYRNDRKYDVISSKENTNISIEFLSSEKLSKNNKIYDFLNDKKSFKVHAFLYNSDKLEFDDIDKIYKSLVNWLSDESDDPKPFIDPFKNTYKQAQTKIGKALRIVSDLDLVNDRNESDTDKGLVIKTSKDVITFESDKVKYEYLYITYDDSQTIEEQVTKVLNKAENLRIFEHALDILEEFLKVNS